MTDKKDLLQDMREQVIYTDKVTMPIPLYERMKDALTNAPSEQTDHEGGKASGEDVREQIPGKVFIAKDGLYFRHDARGYTNFEKEAGVFDREWAEKYYGDHCKIIPAVSIRAAQSKADAVEVVTRADMMNYLCQYLDVVVADVILRGLLEYENGVKIVEDK